MNRDIIEAEIRLRLLKRINAANSHLTQRDLAGYLGISLGKTHSCLTELIHKGYVKANRFKNSRNKSAYSYVLTPQGFEEKLQLLMQFLRRKQSEYRMLEQEIAQHLQEVGPYHPSETQKRA